MTIEPHGVVPEMETSRLKIKIGEHEFESEGPSEIVQAQFAGFKELIGSLPQPVTPTTPAESPSQSETANGTALSLDRIMKLDGRVVSLTARCASLEDEILLVLLGQKALRNNESVTGAEIMDGLKLTGRTVARIDYQIDKMAEAGDVITVGTGRARRYRLTNTGASKATTTANSLLATVA